MNPIIIQLFGFVGLLFLILSFQKNKRSFTLMMQLVCSIFYALHFFFLNAFAGVAVNVINVGRASLFTLRDTKPWLNSPWTMYGVILSYWIASIIVWQNYLSLLPSLAMTFSCISLWSSDTKRMRLWFLAGRPLWIVYDYMTGSYAGLVTEAFLIGSLLFAMARFDVKPKSL